jgi:hypothetical protein
MARGPTEQKGVAEHFAYVAELVERAIVTMGGPLLTPMAGGMMITRPGLDEETLRSIVERDPAVQCGLIRGEVHPWLITVGAGTSTPS